MKRDGKMRSFALANGGKVTVEGRASLADVLAKSKDEKHDIDERLATMLVTLSDHFGGRTIDVVAGYWAAPSGSKKKHAQHTGGRAVDLRVEDVPLDVVRDYCSTFAHAGVGYYPNENLVHLDVRKRAFSWTEKSAKSE
jgi:uncharacterized protein YcbK (DUF882 family)